MATRKTTSTTEALIAHLAMPPRWAALMSAMVSYFLLHAWHVQREAGIASGAVLSAGLLLSLLVSVLQYLVPVLCLLGAAVSTWRHGRHQALMDCVLAGRTADVLDGLTWHEFEMLVGEAFRRLGYRVAVASGPNTHRGVDLVLRKDGHRHFVQCRQWRAYEVGVQVVRELHRAMTACGAASGFVVSSGRFTRDAQDFADRRNLMLIDEETLFELIRSPRRARARDGTR